MTGKGAVESTGSRRPPKRPAADICKELGFPSVEQYIKEVGWEVSSDEFLKRAFPEFFGRNGDIEVKHEPWADLSSYIPAYECTYRHHYAMEDDWLAAITDPDIACFTWPGNTPVPADDVAARPHEHLPFEMFERAMLCVADDAYFKSQVCDLNGDGNMVTTWICRWRRRLGRPVVAGVDDEPVFHSAVWRDNWRRVRHEVTVLNARRYPEYDPHAHEDGSDDKPAESPSGALLALARLLAYEFGLRKDRESYHEIARDISRLARGPWKEYIATRSRSEPRFDAFAF
nr:hypothetical protein [Candidatus Sigynarchaeum springense]